MLDRKIKDVDASIELLMDRKKLSRILCYIFIIIGWTTAWVSICFLPYMYDEIGIGAGIVLLIIGTLCWNDTSYYNILIKINNICKKE